MIKNKIDLKSLPVYEISSDEDEDEGGGVEEVKVASAKPLATANENKSGTKAGNSRSSKPRSDVPPLLRAREKNPQKGPPGGERIFIDLT